jgi:hypothetical protein
MHNIIKLLYDYIIYFIDYIKTIFYKKNKKIDNQVYYLFLYFNNYRIEIFTEQSNSFIHYEPQILLCITNNHKNIYYRNNTIEETLELFIFIINDLLNNINLYQFKDDVYNILYFLPIIINIDKVTKKLLEKHNVYIYKNSYILPVRFYNKMNKIIGIKLN